MPPHHLITSSVRTVKSFSGPRVESRGLFLLKGCRLPISHFWRTIIVWEGTRFRAPISLPFCTVKTKEILMFRLRFATVAVAAGLGLVSGCLCLSEYPLFARFRAHPAADCCGAG